MTTTTTNKRTTCKYCGKEYSVKFHYELKTRKYCSYNCYHKTIKDRISGKNNPRWTGGGLEKIICLYCKKEFTTKRNNVRKRKFCDIKCKGKYYSGEKNPKYSGKNKRICIICGKTFERKKNEINAKFCSKKCYHNSMPQLYKGENASNWQGGKADRKNIIRKSIYYRNWQKKVYKRDNGQCKLCGSKKKLQTHHIIPLRDNIKLIFKAGNGILLCKDCHEKVFYKEYEFVEIFNKILRDYTLDTYEGNDIVRPA